MDPQSGAEFPKGIYITYLPCLHRVLCLELTAGESLRDLGANQHGPADGEDGIGMFGQARVCDTRCASIRPALPAGRRQLAEATAEAPGPRKVPHAVEPYGSDFSEGIQFQLAETLIYAKPSPAVTQAFKAMVLVWTAGACVSTAQETLYFVALAPQNSSLLPPAEG